MKQIRRIFITGATGFIGSALALQLLNDGYTVGILARKTSDLSKIGTGMQGITICSGDIRDSSDISKIISDFSPDCILHLVTYYAVEHVAGELSVMIDTNVKGTVNILEAARESGVKLFINTSTCAVYGQKDRALREDDDLDPQNLYAVTKLQAEEACRFYALNYGVRCITLRLFPPYGPGDHERRLIPYVIQSLLDGKSPALTSGKQKWDFLYRDDVVRAFCAAITTTKVKKTYDVINIGTGQPSSVRDIVENIRAIMGKDVPLSWDTVPHRKNEVWYNSADIRKAKKLLGWAPLTTVPEGLEKTVEYFRALWEKTA
jgi:nucleoside-diphosphate-sugar epimerase